MVTNWVKEYRKQTLATRTNSSLVYTAAQVPPPTDEIESLELDDYCRAQASQSVPNDLRNYFDGLRKRGKNFWIPISATKLKFKVLIPSHAKTTEHSEAEATKSILKKNVTWRALSNDVSGFGFVSGRLQCIVTRTVQVVPKPPGSALHVQSPNEVVHFDFLYISSSSSSGRYILIIKDDLGFFGWLWLTAGLTAIAAADAMTTWIATFGIME
ncbi:hypothetical protein BWQ96_06648 [Gracilariopsis chorda]|uniref:Uncharacterized protein n=1 Tax=Gracilariopsis chorda TaxID=448386 RepID=A0A2V3IND4_9FLOR|nr:hypothetical protein BWQ96_06648 [Gracilariopsis chorda]|eukprot:PXF43591.1 hypothetical protein BWQ96_06648 [Gracilariopsis chorda]